MKKGMDIDSNYLSKEGTYLKSTSVTIDISYNEL